MDLGRDSAKSASRDAAEKRPVEPAMSKGAASGAAMDPVGDSAENQAKVAGPDAVGGDAANNPAKVAAADAAAIAARARQAKRAKVGTARRISKIFSFYER